MINIDNEIPITIMFQLFEIFSVIEHREQLYRDYGIVIEVRAREQGHNSPHIHAKYNQYNVSVDIANCKILKGNLPKHKMDLVLNFVKNNKNFLIDKWLKYHDYGFNY